MGHERQETTDESSAIQYELENSLLHLYDSVIKKDYTLGASISLSLIALTLGICNLIDKNQPGLPEAGVAISVVSLGVSIYGKFGSSVNNQAKQLCKQTISNHESLTSTSPSPV